MIRLWYLNNSDEPTSVELPQYKTFSNKEIRNFLDYGAWISDRTWIPPHRFIRVDV